MRRTSSALLLSVLVPGLLLVPVLTPASAAPVPVAPGVVELAVRGVDPAAAAADGAGGLSGLRLGGTQRRTVLLTSRRATADYGMVGVTWDGGGAVGAVEAWVRTRTAGAWSHWRPLGGAADEEPDAREARGTRAGTTPLWVGRADGVQVRVDVLSGRAPTGLRVALVDPGRSAADADAATRRAPLSSAHAATAAPAIRSRADWGADESIRTGTPSYASSVEAVVLHHTASSNSYSAADVPSLLRGFYAYHVKSRGWSDIGYNVLVDRFGTAWEGRAGGLSRAVIGAHAGGFNTGTVGVSMVGTYETAVPSPAMLETVAQVVAWKAAAAGVDPLASVQLTSGGSTRFPAGTVVTLPTVMGHRAVSTTSCPGVQGMAALPSLRERAAALVAAGQAPTPMPATGLELVAPSSAPAGSTASVLVRGGAGGADVQVLFGKRGQEGAVVRRNGVLGLDGTYRTSFVVDDDYTVFAVSDTVATPRATVLHSPALTTAPVTVASPVGVQGPVTSPPDSPVLVTATGPAGAEVSVWFRPEGEARFTRQREGRLDASGRYTTSYSSDRPHDYFARSGGSASAQVSTAVGPVPNGLEVTAPASVPAGASVPVAVQGTPGQPVDVWFARGADPSSSLRRTGVLGPDGMYRTSYVATADHTFFATSGGRSSTRRTTLATGAVAGTATAPRVRLAVPASVDAGSPVPVTVTGTAGAGVELWTRRRGAAVWTRSHTGTLDTSGRWSASYAGTEDHELWAASGGLSSADATALVVPVLAGPPRAPLGARVQLTGRARPADTVVLESRRRSTGAVTRRTLLADGSGAFATSYAADDEYVHRVTTAGRTGALRRTAVSPTAVGPAAAARGTAVVLSGTARPGARVEVLLRLEDRPAAGAVGRRTRLLPRFRTARTVTADTAGRWRTSLVPAGRHSWFARADGGATAVKVTAVS